MEVGEDGRLECYGTNQRQVATCRELPVVVGGAGSRDVEVVGGGDGDGLLAQSRLNLTQENGRGGDIDRAGGGREGDQAGVGVQFERAS